MFTIKRIPDGNYAIYRKNQLIKAGTKEDLHLFIRQTQSKPKEYVNQFYCSPNCTECCQQLINVSETEIFKIRRYLKKVDPAEIERLRSQERDPDVCPLLDIEKGKCSVYEVRPDLCQSFGHYTGAMCCSYNMDAELKSVEGYFANMFKESAPLAGKLGENFNWEKGLIR